MNGKRFWVGFPLLAVLAVAATVLLRDRSAPLPEDEGAEAPAQQVEAVRAAPDTPAALPSGSAFEDVSDFARLQALRELAAAAIAAAGDLTTSSLTGDGLGYLDVDAIINNNDPSSIVAFLQAHSDETGADESLEIEIAGISEYPTGKKVLIKQVIDGKRRPYGSGSIFFDPATGAVQDAMVSLVTLDPALAASVVILQDEAVAIAREAAASYVQPRLLPGARMTMDATAKELRYTLDPETNKSRLEWPVWVSADGFYPGLDWEVLVDASTGEIVGARDLMEPAAGACSDLTFSVCDGSIMTSRSNICAENGLVHPLPQTNQAAAAAIAHAEDMTRDIKAANPSYIGAVRGTDCNVEIILDVPDALLPTVQGQPAGGMYDPANDRILLSVGAGKRVAVHEVMHALTKTPYGPVEHGLVTAGESLNMGGGWSYGNENYTGTPPFVSSATHHSVAHIFYKLSTRVTKNAAFTIVTETDREAPTSTSAHSVIFREAKRAGAGTAVTGIYKGMGIWPSQADIDDIVDSVISAMETVGPLQVPPRAEMEDKVEELVNEQLRDGLFDQGTIFVRVIKKAEEYRLERVEEEERERAIKEVRRVFELLPPIEKAKLRRRMDRILAAMGVGGNLRREREEAMEIIMEAFDRLGRSDELEEFPDD